MGPIHAMGGTPGVKRATGRYAIALLYSPLLEPLPHSELK